MDGLIGALDLVFCDFPGFSYFPLLILAYFMPLPVNTTENQEFPA